MSNTRTPQQRIAGGIFLVLGIGAVAYFVNSYVGGGTTSALLIGAFVLAVVYIILADLVGRAAKRKGRNQTSWFFIALLFGVVIPAVIVAILSPAPSMPESTTSGQSRGGTETKKCPMCAEWVKSEAVVCKHCGSNLSEAAQE